jgi:predicted XRE-type DNA-binding protein
MDLSKIYTITILTDNEFSIKQWMIEQTNLRMTNRYKQIHIAEDIGVNGSQLSRFLTGNTVKDSFYEKWFKWYIQQN